jgi:microsomal dipeptidase-like Zn-dependent dipeptidase
MIILAADFFASAGHQDDHAAIPTHREFALITAALLKRGYSDSIVANIIGGNFMRFFREVTGSAE